MFFNTYKREYFKGDLSNNMQYKNAISLHAVKQSQDMYNLHFHYRQTLLKYTTAPNVSKVGDLISSKQSIHNKISNIISESQI